MSNKFKKHDFLGIPHHIIIGSKSKEDEFEFKEIDGESQNVRYKANFKRVKKLHCLVQLKN